MPTDIQEIFADRIDDPVDAMRTELDRDALWELADDIKKNGLINPITVRPKGERFEVVAGHRRFTSCKMAGKLNIPCVVRDVDDNTAFGIMASENLVREDVDPVDESMFVSKIIAKQNKSVGEVATMLRRSVAWVEDRLTVASMPDYLREYLRLKQIKLGAALALNQIDNDSRRRMWVDLAVRDGVSVRVAEYWLHQWKMEQLPGAVPSEAPPDGQPPSDYQPMMFECAIDGKKYPIGDTTMICVYRGNLQYVSAIRSELFSDSGATPHPTPQN